MPSITLPYANHRKFILPACSTYHCFLGTDFAIHTKSALVTAAYFPLTRWELNHVQVLCLPRYVAKQRFFCRSSTLRRSLDYSPKS